MFVSVPCLNSACGCQERVMGAPGTGVIHGYEPPTTAVRAAKAL